MPGKRGQGRSQINAAGVNDGRKITDPDSIRVTVAPDRRRNTLRQDDSKSVNVDITVFWDTAPCCVVVPSEVMLSDRRIPTRPENIYIDTSVNTQTNVHLADLAQNPNEATEESAEIFPNHIPTGELHFRSTTRYCKLTLARASLDETAYQ